MNIPSLSSVNNVDMYYILIYYTYMTHTVHFYLHKRCYMKIKEIKKNLGFHLLLSTDGKL